MARRVVCAAILALGICAGAAAQGLVAPDTSVGAALRNLASRAHDVFVGQVISITRTGGVVNVLFRVDQSVAGSQGTTYTLREWAGLWPPGEHRFFVGERALLFVNAAGAAGFSSPVDGEDGVVPVMPASSAAAAQIDVRRLSARVLRVDHAPLADADNGAVALADAVSLVRGWQKASWIEPQRQALPAAFRPAQPPQVVGRVVDPQPPFVGPPTVVWEPIGKAKAPVESVPLGGADE